MTTLKVSDLNVTVPKVMPQHHSVLGAIYLAALAFQGQQKEVEEKAVKRCFLPSCRKIHKQRGAFCSAEHDAAYKKGYR
jgi:hypothetical protein